MGGGNDWSESALETTAYLSRSTNRIELLRVLAETATPVGEPPDGCSGRELRERLGISRSTSARILGQFTERGWVQRTPEGDYALTPTGRHVEATFCDHFESLAAIRHLGDAIAILPREELDIGLQHFVDATVRRPMSGDPTELARHLASRIEDATRFQWLSYVGPPRSLDDAVQEGVLSNRLSARGVITDTLVEYYREHFPSNRLETWQQDERLQPHTDSGLEMYSYDGHVPCNLYVVDETTLIENSQVPDLQPGTVIETDDDTVRLWADRLIETYVEDAERIGPFPRE